ncbi:MAG: hypothetical protein IID38_07365 [Planctomycetes bacterium]|nr:hypothetical protein [Planctomycetota bacterium]
MAKQFANPIERHVEKAVLGVAGLLLILVIARYLATSPNQLEMGGESIEPSGIHAKLAQNADTVRKRIRDASFDIEMPEPLENIFSQSLATLKPTPLPGVVAFGPEVPIVDVASTVGQAKLVEVVPLQQPVLTSGRSMFQIQAGIYTAVDWVTVASLFDVKEQSDRQRMAYGAARHEVVYGPIDLQRRARHPDGSWSDSDWHDVEPWPVAKLPRIPNVQLVPKEGKMIVERTNIMALEEFERLLRKPELVLEMLRPLMIEETHGTPWSFAIISSYRDVLMQDDEIVFPNEPPSANPADRFGILAPTALEPTKVLTPAQEITQTLREGRRLLEEAMKNLAESEAVEAYNKGAEVLKDSAATARDEQQAQLLMDKAEQAEKDIIRRRRTVTRGGHLVRAPDDQGPKRDRLPVQQVWAHDARPESVVSGMTYQYRSRANILNRLAGQPKHFADPADATVVLIPGPWSEPSDAITIPPAVEFYFTRKHEREHQIRAELFRWFEGVWTKSRPIKFAEGDVIAATFRHDVPDFFIQGAVDRAVVEVETEAVIVDIDFQRPYRERKRGTGRSGFKFGSPTQTCGVTYVDAGGRIQERLVPVEKAHPGKRAASNRTFKAPSQSK